jgi:hypothetical protein
MLVWFYSSLMVALQRMKQFNTLGGLYKSDLQSNLRMPPVLMGQIISQQWMPSLKGTLQTAFCDLSVAWTVRPKST